MNHMIGYYLNKNIYNKLDVLLFPVNTVLHQEHITILASQHIKLSEEDISEITSTHKKAFYMIKSSNDIPLENIKKKIIPKIREFSLNPDILSIFTALETKDEYTYKHSFSVAVLSTMIGSWMGLQSSEMDELTISAFLHDIGKLRISDDIINKTVSLNKQEFEEIKKHTLYGYELINNTYGTSEKQALAALQHHEREDGSGYPLGIKGNEMGILSKIVAVSDVFHAMLSKRTYKGALPLFQVLRELSLGAYGLYEPTVIHCLIRKIMNTLIGNNVMLSDGDEAKIIIINIHDLIHPMIRKHKGLFIDLSKEKELEIVGLT
jgi:HD-GYP domain-containing protein (c-di-GMP phosphodiesterase class II)